MTVNLTLCQHSIYFWIHTGHNLWVSWISFIVSTPLMLLGALCIAADRFTSELADSPVSHKDAKGCLWRQYHMLRDVTKQWYLMPWEWEGAEKSYNKNKSHDIRIKCLKKMTLEFLEKVTMLHHFMIKYASCYLMSLFSSHLLS